MKDNDGIPMCPECKDYYSDHPRYGKVSSCIHAGRPSPLVIAADQLAKAIEATRYTAVPCAEDYIRYRELRTALANYKRLREG